MGEVPFSPEGEGKFPVSPKNESADDFDTEFSRLLGFKLSNFNEFGMEPEEISSRIPTNEELPAMEDWERRNQDALSKLSEVEQRKAYQYALQELRAERAREQIRQAGPDGTAEPGSGGDA